MGSESDSTDEDSEWRFSLSDLEADDESGNVAGSLGPAGEITPGDISPEHALFVALGVLAAGLVVFGFVLALI